MNEKTKEQLKWEALKDEIVGRINSLYIEQQEADKLENDKWKPLPYWMCEALSARKLILASETLSLYDMQNFPAWMISPEQRWDFAKRTFLDIIKQIEESAGWCPEVPEWRKQIEKTMEVLK